MESYSTPLAIHKFQIFNISFSRTYSTEHRNMPVDDAINLIGRDFSNYKAGGRSVPLNTPFANERHPDPIQVLVNLLADNHQLTVLQYDRIIKYLEMKREEQIQIELGDAKDLASGSLSINDPKQAELQSRILNILNSNKPNANLPVPSPVPAPAPVPAAAWAIGNNNYALLNIIWNPNDKSCSIVYIIFFLSVAFINNGMCVTKLLLIFSQINRKCLIVKLETKIKQKTFRDAKFSFAFR